MLAAPEIRKVEEVKDCCNRRLGVHFTQCHRLEPRHPIQLQYVVMWLAFHTKPFDFLAIEGKRSITRFVEAKTKCCPRRTLDFCMKDDTRTRKKLQQHVSSPGACVIPPLQFR